MPIREITPHGDRIIPIGDHVRIRTDGLDFLPLLDEQLVSTKHGANLIITYEHGPFARIKEWIRPNSTRTVIPLFPDTVYQTRDTRYEIIDESIKMRRGTHHWTKRKRIPTSANKT